MVGKTVAHYRIVEKLGEGGMGAVYRAEDQKLDRMVALKFVLVGLGEDLGGQERLMREAKACASLNHPNITTIHDFGEHDSRSFIVMEFVEGTTLQDAIRERSFSAEEVVRIGTQIADALSAAHDKGIIHRDLKSANVMLDASGRVKVMDFGLAKLAEGSFLTQTGTTLGTAAYMSPEQVRGDDLTPRSDIYSLGVVLYELATGVTPYPHAHQLAVMYAVANEDPPPPRERQPDVPEALEAAILKAMAKDPAERFASCAEFSAALRGAASPASALPRPQSPAFPQKKWFRVGVPVVIVAVLVAIGLLVQGPVLSGGGSPQLTAVAHYDSGITHWAEGQSLEVRRELQQADERFREARNQLQRSVDLDPSSSAAWSKLAAVNAKLGEYEQAVMQCERAIALDGTNTEAYYNLGLSREETGDFAGAREAYASAVRIDSSFTAAYSALGNLMIERGDAEEALPLLLRAVEKTPESEYLFLIHKNLGKAYLALGRYEEAATHLVESLDTNPDWPETTALLARTYDAVGMNEEARPLWERYLELETDEAKLEAARERLSSE